MSSIFPTSPLIPCESFGGVGILFSLFRFFPPRTEDIPCKKLRCFSLLPP